jgi:hypothetical protein
MKEYNISLGLDGDKLFKNFKETIGLLEKIEASSGEVGKTMDEAFSKGTKASEEFESKIKTTSKNIESIKEVGKIAGKDIGDALSGKSANSSDFTKKIETFKKGISEISTKKSFSLKIEDSAVKELKDVTNYLKENFDSIQSELNAGVAKFEANIEANQQNIKALNTDIKSLEETIEGLAPSISKLNLEDELNSAKQALQEELAILDQNKQGVKELEDANKNLASEINNASNVIKQFEDNSESTDGKLKSLKSQLREIKSELAQLEMNGQAESEQFRQLSARAGELEDQIGDTNAQIRILASDTAKFDALIEGASGLVGAFAVAQGAIGLFGEENEELEKALLKVNSAMAILQGLQQVANTLNKDSAFSVIFLRNSRVTDVAATAAQTAATTTQTAAQIEATAVTAALSAATEVSSVVVGSNAAASIAAATAASAQAAANTAATAATTANTGATAANTVVAVDAAAAAAALSAAEAALTSALVAEAEAEVAATAATLARITANTEEAISAEAAAVATLAQATAARQLAAGDVAAAAAAVANTTAQGASTVAMGGASIAANILGFALKAIGIGLIITAVAALVEYWDELTDAMKKLLPAGQSIGKMFDTLKSYAFGVGEAILKALITPVNAMMKILDGDIKGAFDAIKAGYNVVDNFQTGFNRQQKRNQEKYENEREAAAIKAAKRELERRKNRGEDVYKQEQALFAREITLLKKTREKTEEVEIAMQDAQDKRIAEFRKKREDDRKKAEADAKKKADEAEKKRKEEEKRNNDLVIKYGDELSKIKLENEKQTSESQIKMIRNEARLRIEAIERENATTAAAKQKAAELIAEINKKAKADELEVEQKAAKEKFDLQLAKDKQLAELKKDGLSKDIELLKLNSTEQIEVIREKYKDDEATQKALIETVQSNLAKKEIEIKNKYAAETLKTDEEKAILGVELASTYAKKTEETERQKQIALLRVKLEFAVKNLNQIIDDGTEETKIRKLNAEKAVNEAQESVKEAVKKNKNRDFDFLDFLGIGEGLEPEDRQKLRDSINQSAEILKEFTSFMIDNYQEQMDAKAQQVEQTQSEIDDLESQLEDEKSLRDQGLANNVEVIEAEIAEKERQKEEQIRQEEELLEKKKNMQKVQLALDTVSQLSGLITASVNIFEGFSTIPIVGIPLAIAMIGLMFGTFVATKAKAAQAINQQTVQHGEGGEISGKSHSQGGEKYYNADGSKVKELEDGEFVVRKRQYGKFGKLVRAINDNDFSRLTVNDYAVAEMFRGMGFDFDTGVQDVKNLQLTLMTMGYSSNESQHLAEISEGIAQLVEAEKNTPKSWSDGVYNYLKVGIKIKKTRLIPVKTEENEDTE